MLTIKELKTIAVIGPGDIGHGIAQVALMTGYQVNLCGRRQESLDQGVGRIGASLEKLASKGKISGEVLEGFRNGKLKATLSLEEAVKDTQLIIEAVPEDLQIKIDVLRRISDSCAEDAVIATNTSSMSITMLAENVAHPENMAGMHYFNPAVLMKLVEVIRGDKTSDETTEFIRAYAERAGKTVVLAKKDTPGFIANRIVAPVVVYNGLCVDLGGFTPADIDLSMMKNGQKMGPMELADYTGIDVTSSCQEYYHLHLSEEYGPSETARRLMKEGHLGKKTGSGYYVWPMTGRPKIDPALYTGRYDPDIPNFIQANEACKLYEEGVCSLEECDLAIRLGYNMEGPIEYIRRFEPEKVTAVLEGLAEQCHKEIFRPVDTIRSGAYKQK